MFIVPAAVSDENAIATMGYYNSNGASSSLSEPAENNDYSRRTKLTTVVPVLTMSAVLASVPPALTLGYLMTDMQGHDFRALRSAGDALRRVHYLKTEVWLQGRYEYTGTENDCEPPRVADTTRHAQKYRLK
eukprot:7376507-Prymnesium_polylepis.1